jgi:hypothetical protein
VHLAGPDRSREADAAVRLWSQGLRPVPLLPIGALVDRPGQGRIESDGKQPIGEDWAVRPYSSDADLRTLYRLNPGAGVGLALGLTPEGQPGLVDLEIDDREAAAATLRAIFGEAGPPRTSGWTSARGEHRGFMLYPADAGRLLEAGITQSVLSGQHHPCLKGLEVRLGTLDPNDVKQTQSAVPPTRTRNKDGSASPRRRYIDADAGYDRIPAPLIDYLITHLGRRSTPSGPMTAPDRSNLEGLSPIGKFMAQLGKMNITWTQSGEEFACRCPSHWGQRANLNFREADDGRLLLHCKRGCEFDEVLAAVNLTNWDAHYYPARPRAILRGPRASNLEQDREISEKQLAKLDFMYRLAYDALRASPAKLQELADQLGVSTESLQRIGVGWREDVTRIDDQWVGKGEWAWIFAEENAHGEIVGLLRRYENPEREKRLIAGGRRGLTVPIGWRDMPGPVYVVEGASDVAAMLTIGLCAIGRPNNTGGAADLAVLLSNEAREIVVFGERDQKPDAKTWPGDPRPFARDLARRLGRKVKHQLPPAPHKDVRAFVSSQLTLNQGTEVR